MQVKALKNFISTTHGDVTKGQILEVSEGRAKHLNAHGLTAPLEYETKVIRQVPTVPGGEPSSSSPADQASPKKTRKQRKAKSSRSTAPYGTDRTRTPSTQGTTSGGTSIGMTGETSED